MRFCENCERLVKPHKEFMNSGLFIIGGFLTGGMLWFLYPIYFFFFKKGICPKCGGKEWKKT